MSRNAKTIIIYIIFIPLTIICALLSWHILYELGVPAIWRIIIFALLIYAALRGTEIVEIFLDKK